MFCEPWSDVTYYIFSPEAPALLYYSHIPAAVVALLLSIFIFSQKKNSIAAKALLAISLSFAVWSVADLFIWTQTHSGLVMFLWSFWFIFFTGLFALAVYFTYTFVNNRDMSFKSKVLLLIPLLPIILLGSTTYNLVEFDVVNCNAIENSYMLIYSYILALVYFVTSILISAKAYFTTTDQSSKKRILLASIGTILFLVSFSTATYIASIYNLFQGSPETFAIEQYGYFGMTIFIAFLTYVVVKFKAFDVKLLGAQALIISLVILIGSQFLFITSTTNKILTAIALLLTVVLGTYLIRSVKKEIEARELVEQREKELEIANEGQANLLHFITHQVKGYFTKSRTIFQGLVDGDFGEFPKESKEIVQEGFKSATEGVDLVQNVLNASNIEKGTVQYAMDSIDINEVVQDVVSHKQEQVDTKGLNLKTNIEKGDYKTKGDPMQLKEVFKNLIDNAIRYTPKGDVDVNLSLPDGMILFYVKDSGVGITKEDMQKLFKKGSHGENSRDVNPESTGYGLYIVKEIVEAHGGRVWVESEGANKGSTFFVQLPIKN